MSELTREFEKCFAVYYQSNVFIESKNNGTQLVGQGAVLVDKSSGDVFESGSAYSTEHYVKAFEIAGDPFAEPSNRLEIIEWENGASSVKAIKAIRNTTQCGLKEAKDIVDSVLGGISQVVECESSEAAHQLVKNLDSTGFSSRQFWNNEC